MKKIQLVIEMAKTMSFINLRNLRLSFLLFENQILLINI